jgi:endonuclease/exonuclease/phosphatase family metal-dependent hydrolase
METPDLTVMTLNAYFGCEFGALFAANELPQFIATVGELWRQTTASDVPARARRIAHEIAAARPDLVALQEVTQTYTGTPAAMAIKHDFLRLIIEALRTEGVFYIPVAITRDLDQVVPLDTNGNFLRFTDRDAVLTRVDPLPAVRPYDIQIGTFSQLFQIKSPLTGSVPLKRCWIAVDSTIGEAKFRFVTSHIESFDHAIQLAQARELIAELADAALPVIIAGDFNSNANRQPDIGDYTDTYPALIEAGFTDAWAAVNPGDPGNTCCRAADLRNSLLSLDRRVDLILTRGALTPVSAKLVAADPVARTSTGIWPTDHAGIVAALRFTS